MLVHMRRIYIYCTVLDMLFLNRLNIHLARCAEYDYVHRSDSSYVPGKTDEMFEYDENRSISYAGMFGVVQYKLSRQTPKNLI